MTDSPEAVAHRRRNADAVDDGTAKGRVYKRLLHLQVDFQEADDEAGEDALLDILDAAWKNDLLPGPRGGLKS